MITAHDLAKRILADRPEIATLDHHSLSEQVRLWVSDLYLSALSRVKASEGLSLPIDAQDRRQMNDLAPHYTSFGAIVGQIELILSGQQATQDPYTALKPPNTVDPSQMNTQTYKQWREQGNAPFTTSHGLIN